MDTDYFTFPATSTPAAVTMMTEPPPAVVAGALPAAAAACRPLPFPRFAAAASTSPPPCWSPTAATGAPPVTRSSRAPTLTAMAAAQQGPPPCAGGDAAAAEAVVVEVEEDRMDLLWEDFNEELGARGVGGLQQARGLWLSGSSDGESSSEPAAASRGCAPVLRPSSRAGGAVRHCRRRAGTWVLLMRIFRRLFVIEKTTVSAKAARRHHVAAATARASF